MTELADPSLTVRFPLLTGRDTTRVTSYSLKSAYTTSTDSFLFSLFDEDRSKLLRLEMQPVELLINSASQMIGRIDATEIGDDGSAVSCEGRDYIADLVECRCDPSAVVKEGMQVGEVLKLLFGPVGITSIVSDDEIAMRNIRASHSVSKRGKSKHRHRKPVNNFKPEPGEGLYEYGNRLVARFGATIQPGRNRGELVIDEPSYDQDPVAQIICSDDSVNSGANNVIDARARRDWSNFPTFALFTNKAGGAGDTNTGISATRDIFQAAAQSPELLDIISASTFSGRTKPGDKPNIGKGELYRFLYHRDNDSKTQEQLENAIARAVSERLRETLRYTVTLRGHQDPKSGALWTVDTIVGVNDAIRGVNEALWVHSREFSYSQSTGAITRLELWRPGSFLINSDA